MRRIVLSFNERSSVSKTMRASSVVLKVENETYSDAICEWACQAFASISARSMSSNTADIVADFLDSGACELIITLMAKYGKSNVTILKYLCATILHLCWSSIETSEYFGCNAVCDVLMHAISFYPNDSGVAEYAVGAIGILAEGNILNTTKLTRLGACSTLVQLGAFGLVSNNAHSAATAAYVCLSLSQFADRQNLSVFISSNASALVMDLFAVHTDNFESTYGALVAISVFCKASDALRNAFGGDDRLYGLLLKCVNKENDVLILYHACEALQQLTFSAVIADMFAEKGAAAYVLDAYKEKLVNQRYVGLEVCLGVWNNLASRTESENARTVCIQQLRGGDCVGLLSRESAAMRGSKNGFVSLLNSIAKLQSSIADDSIVSPGK